MSPEERQAFRRHVRQLRRSLPAEVQTSTSARICELIAASPVFAQSRHISFFLAADGEIDLFPLLELASEQGRQCYLPVSLTDGSDTLHFLPWQPGAPLRKTRLGVLEPANDSHPIPARSLDLVLTPLVAFDSRCFRMGMGKGYYDRTFSYRLDHGIQEASDPKLVGVAHACQKVDRLECEWWDVPLDAIVTAEAVYGDAELIVSGD